MLSPTSLSTAQKGGQKWDLTQLREGTRAASLLAPYVPTAFLDSERSRSGALQGPSQKADCKVMPSGLLPESFPQEGQEHAGRRPLNLWL